MLISEEKQIMAYLYRKTYTSEIYSFQELVKEAIICILEFDKINAEDLADKKINKVWACFLKDYEYDLKNNIVPLFDIVDDKSKLVKWIGISRTELGECKRHLFMDRPELYKFFDKMTNREYEALACVICGLMGAENKLLTDAGNEGGIDFIASIKFSTNAHFLFGIKGPIRIIGQCKKYNTKDNIGHMKEFTQTLNNVYNLSFRPGEILPLWFKQDKGPIYGWHIAHEGHQSGALGYAKNFGILTSSSKEIIDLICKLKFTNIINENKVEKLKNMIQQELAKEK